MKYLIPILGLCVLVFHNIIGLVVTSYMNFNIMLVNVSILTSIALIFITVILRLRSGFIIGLSYFLCFSGLIRCLLLAVGKSSLTDNYFFLIAMGLLLFEIICVVATFLVNAQSDHGTTNKTINYSNFH